LHGRSANQHCSFRGCPQATSGPSNESSEAVNMTGKAAHIHGAAVRGDQKSDETAHATPKTTKLITGFRNMNLPYPRNGRPDIQVSNTLRHVKFISLSARLAGAAVARELVLSEHQFKSRREDARLITGRGLYTADHTIRAPHANYTTTHHPTSTWILLIATR